MSYITPIVIRNWQSQIESLHSEMVRLSSMYDSYDRQRIQSAARELSVAIHILKNFEVHKIDRSVSKIVQNFEQGNDKH